MKHASRFFVPGSRSVLFVLSVLFVVVQRTPPTNQNQNQEQTSRSGPRRGSFPRLEKAHSYRGELVFVDHANRRGSIRVQGAGTYFRNAPHPFAMLPYGIVRYHGAPADLRDIPLGTVLHVRAFLPPDPKISAVPVLPVDNKEKNRGLQRRRHRAGREPRPPPRRRAQPLPARGHGLEAQGSGPQEQRGDDRRQPANRRQAETARPARKS